MAASAYLGLTVANCPYVQIFFGLNLIFNGVVCISLLFTQSYHSPHPLVSSPRLSTNPSQMWALFTKALARGTSTTQVSILNTSSNFMITALLGLIIFSESLPPLWFLGAALLVAGNVIIGRRDEGGDKAIEGEDEHDRAENGTGEGRFSDGEGDERGRLLVGEGMELDGDLEERKGEQDEEDILQLGSDAEGEDGN